ncbi:hypothetical protein CC79DRAFT_1337363 [Sarocladium strictum]
MSLTHGSEAALRTFGFRDHVATSKTAGPVIKLEGSRITTIGAALWGMYLGGHVEAMDVLMACIGWMAVVDGIVLRKDGVEGSVGKRVGYQGVVAAWGLLGMTSGKYW